MGARTKARKRALDVLYAADVRGVSARTLLSEAVAEGEEPRDYTVVLVEGVSERQAEIDAVLGRYSQAWSVDRMPAVDRNLLRIAVFEVLSGQVDAPVAVSEAVTLAATLSTDESPAFVNGVLGALIQHEPAFAIVEPVDLETLVIDPEFADIDADLDPVIDPEEASDADEFGGHFQATVDAHEPGV